MTKKVLHTTLATTLLSGAAFAGEVVEVPVQPAATPSFELSVNAGYHNKYIWRGLNLGGDLVDATLEASTKAAGLDLTAGIWAARTLDPLSSLAPKNEIDLYVEASKDLGFATASVGYIYYDFSDSGSGVEHQQEVYFGLSKEIAGISTSLTYFWDVRGDNAGYTELALEKSVTCPISSQAIDLGLTLGYLAEESELSHLTGKVSKSFDLYAGITATPYVAYTVELSGLESAYGTSEENEFNFGVSFSYTF